MYANSDIYLQVLCIYNILNLYIEMNSHDFL